MLMCMAGNFSEGQSAMVSARLHGVSDFEKRRQQRQRPDLGSRFKMDTPKKGILKVRSSKSVMGNGHVPGVNEATKYHGAGTSAIIRPTKSILKKPSVRTNGIKKGSESQVLIKRSISPVVRTDPHSDAPPRTGSRSEGDTAFTGGAKLGRQAKSSPGKVGSIGGNIHKRDYNESGDFSSGTSVKTDTSIPGRTLIKPGEKCQPNGVIHNEINRPGQDSSVNVDPSSIRPRRRTSSLGAVLGQISALSALPRRTPSSQILGKGSHTIEEAGGKDVRESGKHFCAVGNRNTQSNKGTVSRQKAADRSSAESSPVKGSAHQVRSSAGLLRTSSSMGNIRAALSKSSAAPELSLNSKDIRPPSEKSSHFQHNISPTSEQKDDRGLKVSRQFNADSCHQEEKISTARRKYTRLINGKLNSAICSKLSANGLSKSAFTDRPSQGGNGLVRCDPTRIPVHRSPNWNIKQGGKSRSISQSQPAQPVKKDATSSEGNGMPISNPKILLQKSPSFPVNGIIRLRKSTARVSDNIVNGNKEQNVPDEFVVKDDLQKVDTDRRKVSTVEAGKLWDRWKSQVDLKSSSAPLGVGQFPVRRAKSSVISMAVIRGKPDGQPSADGVEGEKLNQNLPPTEASVVPNESKLRTPGWLSNSKLCNTPVTKDKDAQTLSRSLSQVLRLETNKAWKSSVVKDAQEPNPSEEGSSGSVSINSSEKPLVVRQCRVGTSLVFGLVSFDQVGLSTTKDDFSCSKLTVHR